MERLAACGCAGRADTPPHQFPTGRAEPAASAAPRRLGPRGRRLRAGGRLRTPASWIPPTGRPHCEPRRGTGSSDAGSAEQVTLAPALRLGRARGPAGAHGSVNSAAPAGASAARGRTVTFAWFVDTGASTAISAESVRVPDVAAVALGARSGHRVADAWLPGGDGGLQAYVRSPPHRRSRACPRRPPPLGSCCAAAETTPCPLAESPPPCVIGYAKANWRRPVTGPVPGGRGVPGRGPPRAAYRRCDLRLAAATPGRPVNAV